ncbi:MAG TPA: hypothetical protein VMZ53_25245 [Kofleriaceae bacterium]|nr:hypothetical protein [Kofleriaceae bacterium]
MTARHVWIDGTRVALDPAALIGQGGEAEVYDLGDGRVLKWWKPADHPDFDGLPEQQAAAERRLAEQPAKLRALPGNLPSAVIAPSGLALASKKASARLGAAAIAGGITGAAAVQGECVGYVMPKITGVPLHSYGEPRWRRENPVDGADVVAALVALHDAIAGLHRAGVVIGDCNDLNVLVDGRRVHLIDVDSYQYGGFACSMFSERFVDPRLCDAQQLVPVRPHDADSDWFAFAVMAFRSLLGVGPWGGVAKSCPATQRALRRVSVLASDVVYPRAAKPLQMLPDDLLALFRDWFERDVRGEYPRVALERLRLQRCKSCGDEHARVRCPSCQTRAFVPPSVVHGRLRYQVIATSEVAPAATHGVPVQPMNESSFMQSMKGTAVWLDGGALMRRTRVGSERIGSVLAGQTRAWVGDSMGVGFYRAGGYAVGFVFKPDRGGLDDRVALPKLRGRLLDAHAVIAGGAQTGADARAWLFFTTEQGTSCVVVDANARVVASEMLVDATWLAGVGGACAAGNFLFVPTDDGVARIEILQGAIACTRVFAETAPLVGAADRLSLSPGGLDVVRRRDAIRMQLS